MHSFNHGQISTHSYNLLIPQSWTRKEVNKLMTIINLKQYHLSHDECGGWRLHLLTRFILMLHYLECSDSWSILCTLDGNKCPLMPPKLLNPWKNSPSKNAIQQLHQHCDATADKSGQPHRRMDTQLNDLCPTHNRMTSEMHFWWRTVWKRCQFEGSQPVIEQNTCSHWFVITQQNGKSWVCADWKHSQNTQL